MSFVPFDSLPGVIWLDGHFIPWKEANMHLLTHAFHYGGAVFEGERIYNSKVFKLREHSQRLIDSAHYMGFTIPYTVEQLIQATEDVVVKQGYDEGYVRPIAWRGSMQMDVGALDHKVHVAIAVWEWPSIFGEGKLEKGISLKLSQWIKPSPKMLPLQAKASGLYMSSTLSRLDARNSGYDDALILDHRGYIAEATAANIFFVKDKYLCTPIPDAFLNGITRQTIVKIATALGVPVKEGHFSFDDLMSADEVFLTGTAYEVQPVKKIQDQTFRIGEMTHRFIDAYHELVRS